jgi:uracil-DNA glycosylase
MIETIEPGAELNDFRVIKERRRALVGFSLTEFAARIRSSCATAVPDFDPFDGGSAARILFVLERPGPQAMKSGFISRDNPDESARNFRTLLAKSEIARADTCLWNIVPWYDARSVRISEGDLQRGAAFLTELLKLMPRVRVVVFVGRRAQRGGAMITLPEKMRCLECPHPSPLNLNTNPHQRIAILEVLREARALAGTG